MLRARSNSKWANVKLRRDFVKWLKVEAAKRDEFMGDLVENLVANALGTAPWRSSSSDQPR